MAAVADDHDKHTFAEPFVSTDTKNPCQINDVESIKSFSDTVTLVMR